VELGAGIIWLGSRNVGFDEGVKNTRAVAQELRKSAHEIAKTLSLIKRG
jgi:prolyl-tRNA editing enzyme YbaK/EbsC (Cys-tRNA(Pro) deacylase)